MACSLKSSFCSKTKKARTESLTRCRSGGTKVSDLEAGQ